MESKTRLLRFCSLLAACLSMVGSAYAQDRVRARVEFTEFELNNIPTPVFKDSTHPKAKRDGEWLQIYAEYKVVGAKKGWLDELELNWSVMVKTPDGRYILLPNRTVYVDIESGDDVHRAVVYIRPAFARRYLDKDRVSKSNVWVHVEATVAGTEVGSESYSRGKSPGAKWWLAKEPRVKLLEGVLLSRDKTPYAPLDYDFYEQIKVPPQTR